MELKIKNGLHFRSIATFGVNLVMAKNVDSQQGTLEIPCKLPQLKDTAVAVIDCLSDISFINANRVRLTTASPFFQRKRDLYLNTAAGTRTPKSFELYEIPLELNSSEDRQGMYATQFTFHYNHFELPYDLILGLDFMKHANILLVADMKNIKWAQKLPQLPLDPPTQQSMETSPYAK